MVNEKELKEAFIKWIDKRYKDKIIATEVGVLSYKNNEFRIADILVVNKHTIAFELKSEADNLNRLLPQLKHFIKFFDYVYIVYWRDKFILENIPKSVGVIEAFKKNDKIKFRVVKKAKINRDFAIEDIVNSLWNSEMRYLLEEKGLLKIPKWKFIRKIKMKKIILEKCKKTEIIKTFRFFLKHRFQKGYLTYSNTKDFKAFTKHKKDLDYITKLKIDNKE